MRQGELFPMLIEQEFIDEYISAQETLRQWKKIEKKFLAHRNKIMPEVVDAITSNRKRKFNEVEIQGHLRDAKELIEDTDNEISNSRYKINLWQDFITAYGDCLAGFINERNN